MTLPRLGASALPASILAWTLVLLSFGFAQNPTLTLNDTKGRSVEIKPLTVTDLEITGIRTSDRKEIKIPIQTLDAKSKLAVIEWKTLTGRLPKKEYVLKLSSTVGRGKDYTVKFKVPEGKYNSKLHNRGIELIFDIPNKAKTTYRGTLIIEVLHTDKKQSESLKKLLSDFNSEVARDLERMTPSERALKEPLMKVDDFAHGDFKGYVRRTDQLHKVATTDGEFTIYTYLSPLGLTMATEEPISRDDVTRILGTLEIVNGH